MTDVRILSEPLGGTPLSLLIQRGDAPSEWLRGAPIGRDAWRRLAADRVRAVDWESSWTMLDPALAATGAAAVRLDRVRRCDRGCEIEQMSLTISLDQLLSSSAVDPPLQSAQFLQRGQMRGLQLPVRSSRLLQRAAPLGGPLERR